MGTIQSVLCAEFLKENVLGMFFSINVAFCCLRKQVKAHAVYGSGEKAKDPFFGLAMGAGSQASTGLFK